MSKGNLRYRRTFSLMLAAAPVAAAIVPSVFAANLTWDAGGTAPAAAKDGSGTWNTTTLFWSNGTTGAGWDNVSTAVFGNNNGAAGNVEINDVSGSVTAAGLIFNAPGSGAYTISAAAGNVLTLSGTNPVLTINSGVNATISAPIA